MKIEINDIKIVITIQEANKLKEEFQEFINTYDYYGGAEESIAQYYPALYYL